MLLHRITISDGIPNCSGRASGGETQHPAMRGGGVDGEMEEIEERACLVGVGLG